MLTAQAMQHNRSVRHLDFSDNSIGGGYEKTQISSGPTTGGASIALALGVNTTIRRINLQWNLLGSKVNGFTQLKNIPPAQLLRP